MAATGAFKIRRDLLEWLNEYHILQHAPIIGEDKRYFLLDGSVQGIFLNGTIIGNLLTALNRQHNFTSERTPKLKGIQSHSARLYNWQALQRYIHFLEIHIPQEFLHQVVDGDLDIALDLVLSIKQAVTLQLRRRFQALPAAEKEQLRRPHVETQVKNIWANIFQRQSAFTDLPDDANSELPTTIAPRCTDTVTDFILCSLARSMNISVPRAAMLLSRKLLEFRHCIHRGEWTQQLLAWLSYIQNNWAHFFQLARLEPSFITWFVSTIQEFLVSQNFELVSAGFELFSILTDSVTLGEGTKLFRDVNLKMLLTAFFDEDFVDHQLSFLSLISKILSFNPQFLLSAGILEFFDAKARILAWDLMTNILPICFESSYVLEVFSDESDYFLNRFFVIIADENVNLSERASVFQMVCALLESAPPSFHADFGEELMEQVFEAYDRLFEDADLPLQLVNQDLHGDIISKQLLQERYACLWRTAVSSTISLLTSPNFMNHNPFAPELFAKYLRSALDNFYNEDRQRFLLPGLLSISNTCPHASFLPFLEFLSRLANDEIQYITDVDLALVHRLLISDTDFSDHIPTLWHFVTKLVDQAVPQLTLATPIFTFIFSHLVGTIQFDDLRGFFVMCVSRLANQPSLLKSIKLTDGGEIDSRFLYLDLLARIVLCDTVDPSVHDLLRSCLQDELSSGATTFITEEEPVPEDENDTETTEDARNQNIVFLISLFDEPERYQPPTLPEPILQTPEKQITRWVYLQLQEIEEMLVQDPNVIPGSFTSVPGVGTVTVPNALEDGISVFSTLRQYRGLEVLSNPLPLKFESIILTDQMRAVLKSAIKDMTQRQSDIVGLSPVAQPSPRFSVAARRKELSERSLRSRATHDQLQQVEKALPKVSEKIASQAQPLYAQTTHTQRRKIPPLQELDLDEKGHLLDRLTVACADFKVQSKPFPREGDVSVWEAKEPRRRYEYLLDRQEQLAAFEFHCLQLEEVRRSLFVEMRRGQVRARLQSNGRMRKAQEAAAKEKERLEAASQERKERTQAHAQHMESIKTPRQRRFEATQREIEERNKWFKTRTKELQEMKISIPSKGESTANSTPKQTPRMRRDSAEIQRIKAAVKERQEKAKQAVEEAERAERKARQREARRAKRRLAKRNKIKNEQRQREKQERLAMHEAERDTWRYSERPVRRQEFEARDKETRERDKRYEARRQKALEKQQAALRREKSMRRSKQAAEEHLIAQAMAERTRFKSYIVRHQKEKNESIQMYLEDHASDAREDAEMAILRKRLDPNSREAILFIRREVRKRMDKLGHRTQGPSHTTVANDIKQQSQAALEIMSAAVSRAASPELSGSRQPSKSKLDASESVEDLTSPGTQQIQFVQPPSPSLSFGDESDDETQGDDLLEKAGDLIDL